MDEMNKLSISDLEDVAGGNAGAVPAGWRMVEAHVQTGYLALRTLPEYNDSNIIYKIENGRVFLVSKTKKSGDYAWAQIDGQHGWVNVKYTIDLHGGVV